MAHGCSAPSPYVRACQCAERELERDAPEGPATEGSPARLEEHCPLKPEVGAAEDEEAPPHRPPPDRDPRVCSLPVAELVEKLLGKPPPAGPTFETTSQERPSRNDPVLCFATSYPPKDTTCAEDLLF